jgi:uncharacterized protein involved in outer membrane biogenesis
VARKIALALGLVLVVLVVAAVAIRSRLSTANIKATLETQASAALGEPVRIGALDVRWFPRPGLTLTQVAVGTSRTLLIDRLVVSTGLRPLLSRHIAEADILVEKSRLDAPRFLALLTTPSSSSSASHASGLPLTIDAIRSIALRDVSLVSGSRTVLVNADAAYSGNRLDIQRLEARSDITQLAATGAVKDLSRRICELTIKARSLNLDELIEFMAPFSSQPATPAVPGPSAPFDITAHVSAAEGRALGATFTDLSTISRVTNGQATLSGLHLKLFGGRADGDVIVHTSAAVPSYEWRGSFSGLDVARLLEFAGASNSMTGTLQARGSLRGAGTTMQAAFTQAAGGMQVVVRDGRVPGLEIVRTVILAFGRPSAERPAGSGEAFTQLAADLAVAGGRASTNNLTFASRDLDMHGSGAVDLRSQGVDLAVDVILSPELSAQAGRDLYRYASEGNRIVLPGRITGTAARPVVTIDTAKALQRALQNTLKSKMKSLFNGVIRQ